MYWNKASDITMIKVINSVLNRYFVKLLYVSFFNRLDIAREKIPNLKKNNEDSSDNNILLEKRERIIR